MLTEEKYILIMEELEKIRTNKDILEAIKSQQELSEICRKAQAERYDLEDIHYELLKAGCAKAPDGELTLGVNFDTEIEHIEYINSLWLQDSEQIQRLREYSNSIPELIKANNLQPILQDKMFNAFKCTIDLNNKLKQDRINLFSKEYKEKMQEYANEGILLYYLETPDLPILHPEITKDDILDLFLVDNCMSFKILFEHFISNPNPSPSMRRKAEDIVAMVENLNVGFYRQAALTAFALIDSEYRNCSNALNGFYEAKKEIKTSKNKSQRITELLTWIDEDDFIERWEIIESHYKKMVTSKEEAVIDRNLLVHGEYYDDKLDITEYDVIKLILLFINIRQISDYVQIYCDMVKNIHIYSLSYLAHKLKNIK